MENEKLEGSCHCGSVKWQFDGDLNQLRLATAQYAAATAFCGSTILKTRESKSLDQPQFTPVAKH